MTDASIRALKPRQSRFAERDRNSPAITSASPPAAKSRSTPSPETRRPAKQIWSLVGSCEILKIGEAREPARIMIKRIKDGLPATEPAKDLFAAVAGERIRRHVESRGLRTGDEIQRVLHRRILPEWRTR
jgi:hypothetical protein